MRRAVTSSDVARELGVSQSTVSLALSGSRRVSDATRARVVDASRRLGYQPQAAARQLRTGRSHTIGLFVPQLGYEAFERILAGIRRALANDHDDERWQVLVAVTDNDAGRQAALTEAVQAHDFDGVILADVAAPSPATVQRFAGRILAIDTVSPGVPIRSVDLAQAARLMLDVLRSAGHRRLCHLTPLPSKTVFADQRTALHEAATAYRRPRLSIIDVDVSGVSAAATTDSIRSVLAAAPATRPTAIVCDDSSLAAGVYAAAADLGLRIPADLSVITSHLDDAAWPLRPRLTGLVRPLEDIGADAARGLLDSLRGRRVKQSVLHPCQLVAGESIAPPADAATNQRDAAVVTAPAVANATTGRSTTPVVAGP